MDKAVSEMVATCERKWSWVVVMVSLSCGRREGRMEHGAMWFMRNALLGGNIVPKFLKLFSALFIVSNVEKAARIRKTYKEEIKKEIIFQWGGIAANTNLENLQKKDKLVNYNQKISDKQVQEFNDKFLEPARHGNMLTAAEKALGTYIYEQIEIQRQEEGVKQFRNLVYSHKEQRFHRDRMKF